MSSQEPVTHWLRQLEAGDAEAAQPLWEVYFQRLVRLAREQLQNAPRGAADEEDVALSAFHSFCRGAEDGRFEDVRSRDSLWRILVRITACKATDHARRERAQKRGGTGGPPRMDADLEQVVGSEPSPEFAALVADECRHRLEMLPEAMLRSVALWKMEGWKVEEIATRLACSPITVKRKLEVIRAIWIARE